MAKIEVKHVETYWFLNEDNEWECPHDDYWIEVGEDVYYDPSDYYGVGYRTYTYAECKQCGALGYVHYEPDEDGISSYIEWSI